MKKKSSDLNDSKYYYYIILLYYIIRILCALNFLMPCAYVTNITP
jgi:hypothetical protein